MLLADAALEHQSLRAAVGGHEAHAVGGRPASGSTAAPCRRGSAPFRPRPGASPNSAPSNSSMPEPAMPARPTISPGRASKLTSTRPVPTVRPRPRVRAAVAVDGAVRAGNSVVLLRADHRLDHLGDRQRRRCRGSGSRRPSRITVTRSAIANTSSSRCETYSTVMPVGRQLAQDREQPLRLAIVERRVGLVEDQHPGLLEQHPGQLDQLPLGDRHRSRPGRRGRHRGRAWRAPAGPAAPSRRVATRPKRVGSRLTNRLASSGRSGRMLSSW